MPRTATRTTLAAAAHSSGRRAEIRDYLALLTGTPSAGNLLELRVRVAGDRMARRFYPAGRRAALVDAIDRLGQRCDVYVGCAPRTRRSGGRDAIDRSWVLWAECDTPAAKLALAAFRPAPTLVIASGSRHGRHAYWALTRPVDAEALEDGNRRLAHAHDADPVCTDAARILRPPGTRNFKRDRPAAVVTVTHRPERRYRPGELVDTLPAAPPTAASKGSTPEGKSNRTGDPLLAITPDDYLPRLTGQPIGSDRKVSCPLHEDATPSLHAYPDHWYCFGCGQGGTIYDLAAALWRLETRGPDFHELRRRLQAIFG